MDEMIIPIGKSSDPSLVGGKGASLTNIIEAGLRVPPGVILTTGAWRAWKAGEVTAKELYTTAVPIMKKMLDRYSRMFPIAVRSGSMVSMPGMMDTILNIGSDEPEAAVHCMTTWARSAGLDTSVIDGIVEKYLVENGLFFVRNAYMDDPFMSEISDYVGVDLSKPDDMAIRAIDTVFGSWDSPKAKKYREIMDIPDDLGTACILQKMASSNGGLSGVALSRGSEDGIKIDWVYQKQGDAVVDGRIKTMNEGDLLEKNEIKYGHVYDAAYEMEKVYGDAVDIEFTFDSMGTMYVLQCRPQKRTKTEAMRIAVQLYKDSIVDAKTVEETEVVDDSVFTDGPSSAPVAQGFPINGKNLVGKIYTNDKLPLEPDSIPIRQMTTTDDIDLMSKVKAIITTTGGPVCHAALVAREIGSTAIVGIGGGVGRMAWIMGESNLEHGDLVTIMPDGFIYAGHVVNKSRRVPGKWSKELRKLQRQIKKKGGLENVVD